MEHPDTPSNVNVDDYTEVRFAQMTLGALSNDVWYDRDSMQFRDGHTHFLSTEYQREGSYFAFTTYWSTFSEY